MPLIGFFLPSTQVRLARLVAVVVGVVELAVAKVSLLGEEGEEAEPGVERGQERGATGEPTLTDTGCSRVLRPVTIGVVCGVLLPPRGSEAPDGKVAFLLNMVAGVEMGTVSFLIGGILLRK